MNIEGQYSNIYLVEKKQETTAGQLKELFPDHRICACDLYVKDSEQGNLDTDGTIRFDDILIVDHHPPLPEMRRHVSSTTFAIRYVTDQGPLKNDFAVAINHTDTDSILSSLIMCGILPPREEFNAAAIAADHTGEENLIGDLLQALEEDRDLPGSIEVLQKVLENRLWVRQKLQAEINLGNYKMCGGVACMVLDKKIDAGLLPWLFPDADAVVVGWPMPAGSKGKWGIKTRLGIHTIGVSLLEMGFENIGGRWDAISNTRHGGTDMEPEEYARMVEKGLSRQRQSKSS
jgi:hypothetical protein